MHNKNGLLNQINTLQNYCETHKESGVSGDFAGFIQPLKTAINTYFSTVDNNLEYDMMKLITQIDIDISKRNTIYENNFTNSLSTNYPYGYDDFTKIFNGDGAFDDMMSKSGSQFLAGFPKINDPLDPTSRIYQTNPIISTWVAKIENAHPKEITKIENIIDFCESGSYNDGLVSMFEDRGTLTVNITKEQLAQLIYVTKGAKEIIQSLNLNVYIPSYI